MKRRHRHSSPNPSFALEEGHGDARKARCLKRNGASSPFRSARTQSEETETRSQTDWRGLLCKTLGASPSISDRSLEHELYNAVDTRSSISSSELEAEHLPRSLKPFYRILHRVQCPARNRTAQPSIYTEKPLLSKNDNIRIGSHLTGIDEVSDLDRYMQKNPGISFVVIYDYVCCNKEGAMNPENPLMHTDELFIFESLELCSSLERLQKLMTHGDVLFPTITPGQKYPGIHRAIYWHREKLEMFFGKRDGAVQDPVGRDHYRGARLKSWPTVETTWSGLPNARRQDNNKITASIKFYLSSWEFDGNFKERRWTFTAKLEWYLGVTVSVSKMMIYPYKLADKDTQRFLEERGKMFWQCRLHHCIAYNGWELNYQERFKDARFVINARSYKSTTKHQYKLPQIPGDTSKEDFFDDLGEELFAREEPPGDGFLLILPIWVYGFSMDDKLWKLLLVARMRNVVWDNKAFQNLVLHDDTKDVIKALITHRVSSSLSTDLIRGKGSGLILLLHGPPGTGKTLTAESVADQAQKLLYRVTCGDIGTQPEAVERYLTGLLRLAKLWDCVVLLDEAEVFLQERSLTDLNRNALVSVFLRVLEYYDVLAGILILTSNRVGTLDEGFKSRIQLALEYPKLDGDARRRVWENFINSLENDAEASAEIDIADLRRNLRNLSVYELNGREIRNAINVARPLALSTGTLVDFKCLKKVIGVQGRFGQYIREINEGLDDDKVAREEGKR
ncbi:hypothetical protein FDECE_153 [Fusarium decemcellulare]|nr:hypothetical protein FDECE_153 [Fusarium decemcellulare]